MDSLIKLFEQVFYESKYVGQVGYHFCSDENLIHNCIFDCIDYSPRTHNYEADVNKMNYRGISITRNGLNRRALYGLSNQYKAENENDTSKFKKWRITLDLEKLTEKYKLLPVNDLYPQNYDYKFEKDFWESPSTQNSYKYVTEKDDEYWKMKGYFLGHKRYELEERVVGSIFELHKYIISIDYIPYIKGLEDIPCDEPFTEFSWDPRRNRKGPEAVINYIKKWNISTNYDFSKEEKKQAQWKAKLYKDYDDNPTPIKASLNVKFNNFIENLKNGDVLADSKFKDLLTYLSFGTPNEKNREEKTVNITIDLKNNNIDWSSLSALNSKFGIKFNLDFKPKEFENTCNSTSIIIEGAPIKEINFSNLDFSNIDINQFSLEGCYDLEYIKGLDFSNSNFPSEKERIKAFKTFTKLPGLKRKDIKWPKSFKKTFKRVDYLRA